MAQGAKFNMLLAVKTLGQQGIKRMGNSMQGLAGRVKNVKLTVDGLAKAYASLRIVQDALNVTVQRAESERRLMLLSQGFDNLASVTEAATAASKKFGLSQTQANREFAQVYARLRPLGISLETIRSVYEGFNTAAKLSGSSATEASNAFLQLSQALGTGALRGDELRSVFEQTPAVIQAIAKEMNVTVGEIKDLAKEGKVTTEFILPALERLRTEGADKLAEAMKGPEQQFRNLNIAIEELKIAAIADNMERILALVNGLTDTTKTLTKIINAPGFKFFFDTLYKLSTGPLDKLNKIGSLFPSGNDKDAEKSGDTLKMTIWGINQETKKAKSLLETTFGKSMMKKLDEFGKGLNDIGSLVGDSLVSAFKGLEDALVNFVTTGKLQFKSLVQSIIADLARITIRQGITQPLFSAFKSALTSSLSGGFGGGTQTVRGSVQGSGLNALDFDNPMASPFATGGFVNKPTNALIGEAGSEYVIRADQMDQAMRRYAKGARGQSVIDGVGGSEDESGNLVGAGAIDVRFDVQRINAVDYVTSQQFEQGIRSATEQGARKGEQMTLRRLQTSPNTRKRIGV
jgi:tape measure domain-containing protein